MFLQKSKVAQKKNLPKKGGRRKAIHKNKCCGKLSNIEEKGVLW
jgi:hypothetical protein